MQLFSCNYFYLVTIIFIINSMTAFTAHHNRQDAIIDGKRFLGRSIKDLQKTIKLYNKIMEDPSAYYESVSRTGQGQNTSVLIETALNKSIESTTNVKGITSGLSNVNYEFLLQELNRKIQNLTIPLTSLTTVRGEEMRTSVASGDVKTQTYENFTTTENHNLYNISSTTAPTTMLYSNTPYFVSNSVLRTTQKYEIYSPTNISGILDTQKEIIKQLLTNIDAAQKVLTNNTTENSLLDSTTELNRLSDESEISSNKTNGGYINDISTLLMKLADVETNASSIINNGDNRKQKSKNPFTALLQKFLKTKNFADVPQI